MNKIYIVHCWDGKKDDGWYPWIDEKISNELNTIFSLKSWYRLKNARLN